MNHDDPPIARAPASVALALSFAFLMSITAPGQTLFGPPGPVQQLLGAVNAAPLGVVTGDFDGDGRPDLLVGTTGTMIWMVPGTGQGGFGTPSATVVPSPVQPSSPRPVAAADFDGDGDQDIVVVDTGAGGNQFQVLLNVGNGSFVPSGGAPISGLASEPQHFAIGAATGSGAPELITIEPSAQIAEIRIYSFSSSLGLTLVFAAASQTSPRSVHTGDVNGDGLLDVVVDRDLGSPFQDEIVVFLRSPAGLSPTPSGPFSWNAAMYAPYVAVGDVNGDLIDDVVGYGTGDPALGTGAVTTRFGASVNPLASSSTVTGLPPASAAADGEWFDLDSDGTFELRATERFIRPPTPLGGGTIVDAPDAGLGYAGSPLSAAMDLDGDSDVDYLWIAAVPVYAPYWPVPTWYWFVRIAKNEAIMDGPCTSPFVAPASLIGQPSPGNPAFFLALTGAPPGAIGALGISTEPGSLALGSCAISLSLDPAHLLLPSGSLGAVIVDTSGGVYLSIPIPAGFPLYEDFYVQWIVEDPTGPLSVGGNAYALSPARKILVW